MEKGILCKEKTTILAFERPDNKLQGAIFDAFLQQSSDYGIQLIRRNDELDTEHDTLLLCGQISQKQIKVALNNAKSLRYKVCIIQDLVFSRENILPELLQFAKNKSIGIIHHSFVTKALGKDETGTRNYPNNYSEVQGEKETGGKIDAFSTIEELVSGLPVTQDPQVNETNSDIYGRVNESTKTYIHGIDDVVILDHFYKSPKQPAVTARNFIQTILSMNNLFLTRCAASKLKLIVHNNLGGHAASGGEFTLDQIMKEFGTEDQKHEYLQRLKRFKKAREITSLS